MREPIALTFTETKNKPSTQTNSVAVAYYTSKISNNGHLQMTIHLQYLIHNNFMF